VTYNLGTGNGYSVLEMIKAFSKASPRPRLFVAVSCRSDLLARGDLHEGRHLFSELHDPFGMLRPVAKISISRWRTGGLGTWLSSMVPAIWLRKSLDGRRSWASMKCALIRGGGSQTTRTASRVKRGILVRRMVGKGGDIHFLWFQSFPPSRLVMVVWDVRTHSNS